MCRPLPGADELPALAAGRGRQRTTKSVDWAEAAEMCGCPVGTIRSRVARARDDLDLLLADEQRRDDTG